MESKEQSLSKIVTALSGVNYGKDVEENHIKRIANSLESVTKEKEKSIIEILSGGSGGGGCVPTTWAELKNLRDNSQLSPGTLYRITDYQCTTAQSNTQSAGHQFDIIVLALSENSLSENAKATNHKFDGEPVFVGLDVGGDLCPIIATGTATFSDNQVRDVTRFLDSQQGFEVWTIAQDYSLCYTIETSTFVVSGDNITVNETLENFIGSGTMDSAPVWNNKNFFDKCNVAAWELNYCLDNDINRFAWAYQGSPARPDIIGMKFSMESPGFTNYAITRRYPESDKTISGQKYYAYVPVNADSSLDLTDSSINWDDINTEYAAYVLKEVPDLENAVYDINDEDEKLFELGNVSSVLNGVPEVEPGKGIIYWMKDEWGNECPYDFKNIKLGGLGGNFTFDYLGDDATSLGEELASFNIVKEYYGDENTSGIRHIPFNNFIIKDKLEEPELCFTRNFLGGNCSGNYFYLGASYNRLGDSCEDNNFYNRASYNRLESKCSRNALSGDNNVLGVNCSANTISGGYNVLGSGCRICTFTKANKNVLGVECERVTLPENADFNKIGNTCIKVTLSAFCRWNTIESDCNEIYMGEWCCYNVIGIGCNHISFGTYCSKNTFETDCSDIYFGTGVQISQLKNYYYDIYVETGNHYLRLICTQNLAQNSKYQHVRIRQRTNYEVNGSASVKEINDSNVNQDHLTVYKTSTVVETNV